MKKAEWGQLIWKVLHCITIKIKDEEFPQERENIIKMITNICSIYRVHNALRTQLESLKNTD